MKLIEEINRIKEVMFESLQGEDKKEYFQDEMDEIERAVQDLSRDGDIETTVKDVVSVFTKAKKVDLTKDIWSKLENTESNKFKKGDIKKVNALALKYNKTSPLKLKKALLSGDYDPPMILQFDDRYHLVAGNTRLSTAAALGITRITGYWLNRVPLPLHFHLEDDPANPVHPFLQSKMSSSFLDT